ncbi:MAG: hypothetical protein H9W81_07965 [Enterococcus sp.]|nr:hypothetical protein [Enterococcus sp.]
MYEVLKDAKAMAKEAAALAEHLQTLLAGEELDNAQIGQAHDYLVTATEALTKTRELLK